MKKLFGTDGIRGAANKKPMTVEIAVKTGRSFAYSLLKNSENRKIIIGKDTRISGDMIMCGVTAGICSMGFDVISAGIIPTPAIAFLTKFLDADAGVVISASHNPFFDNGIKLFLENGYKLSDDQEKDLESIILKKDNDLLPFHIQKIGRLSTPENLERYYIDFLKSSVKSDNFVKGFKIVLDCANGAGSIIAKKIFDEMGIDVYLIFDEPNGININENCGAEHAEILAKKVIEQGADLGLALDGDADRLTAVDEMGNIIAADQLIAIFAKYYKDNQKLKNNTVVTTIMSNMGLTAALKDMDINHHMSDVGDKHVMLKMLKKGAILGGEYSGHIIFGDSQTTGDGILSGLKLIEVICETGKPLSELSKVMSILPQVVINVDVTRKPNIKRIPEICNVIKYAEEALNGEGRVLVRYSGTQRQCRVMVEGEDLRNTQSLCQEIADVVRNSIA